MRWMWILGGLFLGWLATAAVAAEPVVVRAGDRVLGDLGESGAEAGFALDALGGSAIRLKVKATDGAGLEPEILVFDPDDVRVELTGRYRHTAGSGKAKLRSFELPSTGRYTIVVRGLAGTTGAYSLAIDATHPARFVDYGQIEYAFESGLARFSALAGSSLVFKVKGKLGLLPLVRSLIQPDTAEVNVTGVISAGAKVTGSTYSCPQTGDYRLRIETGNGAAGTWKSKIKLVVPGAPHQDLQVDGQPAGTFTDGKKEPGTTPQLPVRNIVQTPEFRLTLSILDPRTGLLWPAGQTMALMVTLENLTAVDIDVTFRSDPWNDIVVRNVSTSALVWRWHPGALPYAPKVTFPWADSRSWSTTWNTRDQGGSLLPPGEYDVVATFATDDPRIPQEARIRIRIQ
jgi:hypothetical protein